MSTKTCECHKIDWSKGSNKYIHIPSGEVYDTNKHEVLLNREELFKSEDLGDYYRVSPDVRSLNYENYFEKGEEPLSIENEYSSNNTRQLTQSGSCWQHLILMSKRSLHCL